MLDKDFWEKIYKNDPLYKIPWEYGRSVAELVQAIKRHKIKKGKALDLCCGAGTQTIYLARQGFDAAGLDLSGSAIERAKKRARRMKVKCNFMEGYALSFLLKKPKFGFILDRGGFHNIPESKRKEYVHGLYGALKKAGKLMLFCFSARKERAWNHFRARDIQKLFSPEFRIEECKEINGIPPSKGRRDLLYFLMKKDGSNRNLSGKS